MNHSSITDERERAPLGRAVGRSAPRLGAQRGAADAGVRAGARATSASNAGTRCSTPAAAPACSCACAPTAARDVSGIDASEGLLEIARERVPEADLRLGDLQTLPYADDTFDLVTGFTSFFFADDMVAALREAGRVARPGRADRDPALRPPGALRPRGDEGGRGHVPRRGPPVVLAAGDRRGTRRAGRADRRARVRLDVGLRVPGRDDAGRAHARRPAAPATSPGPRAKARCATRSAPRSPTAGSRTAATACPTSGT